MILFIYIIAPAIKELSVNKFNILKKSEINKNLIQSKFYRLLQKDKLYH
jgi:hypothetical protein